MTLRQKPIADGLSLNRRASRRFDGTIVLLGTMVACSLVPSLKSGISFTELALFGTAILCCGLCYMTTSSLRLWPKEIWLFVIMAGWTPMCIIHTDSVVFLTNAAGVYIFLGCLIVGFRLPTNQHKQVVRLLFLLVFVGVCAGISLNLAGWEELGSEETVGAWSAGVRGATGNSTAILLVVFAGRGLFSANRVKLILSFFLVALGFWVVAIMGQGRGATILACLAVLCSARTNRQRAIVVLVFVSLITIAVFLGARENAYFAPLIERFEKLRELDSNTRLHDTRYGLNVMWRDGWKGLLVGIPPREIGYELKQLLNTGASIHNGYLDIMVSYGAPSAIPFYIFCASLGIRALRFYRRTNGMPEWIITGTALVVVFLTDELVGSHFIIWRENVVPGILIGMWLAYIDRKQMSWRRAKAAHCPTLRDIRDKT